jgi:hypothetical protein
MQYAGFIRQLRRRTNTCLLALINTLQKKWLSVMHAGEDLPA